MSSSDANPSSLDDRTAKSSASGPEGLSVELERILKFTHEENERHRAFFETLYKWTAGAISVIVVVLGVLVGFVGFRSISDIKKQAQDATTEQLKEMRKQTEQVTAEEVARLKKQVTERIDDEFKTPVIRETIKSAARQQTQTAMMPIISNEVKTQVTTGVSAQLKQEVSPKLKSLQDNETLTFLLTQAEKGDARSFDLLQIESGDPNLPPSMRDLASKTYARIFRAHNENFYQSKHFKLPTPKEELLRLLKDEDPVLRRTAIDSLNSEDIKANLSTIFSLMNHDPDLDVREAAYRRFGEVTKTHFPVFDKEAVNTWVGEHPEELYK